MKLKEVKMMCIKIEPKQNKDGKDYLMVTLADMETGDTFNLVEKDMAYLSMLKPFMPYLLDLDLTSSKYGLNLKIEDIKSIN